MIGFFLNHGDSSVGELFSPYVWGERGWGKRFDMQSKEKAYGADLKLLLILFYVAGSFDISAPDCPKLMNYSNKKKDIGVKIPVSHHEFHYVAERERRLFIVNSIRMAVRMVRERLEERKLDINFDQLEQDVELTSVTYLDDPEPMV